MGLYMAEWQVTHPSCTGDALVIVLHLFLLVLGMDPRASHMLDKGCHCAISRPQGVLKVPDAQATLQRINN